MPVSQRRRSASVCIRWVPRVSGARQAPLQGVLHGILGGVERRTQHLVLERPNRPRGPSSSSVVTAAMYGSCLKKPAAAPPGTWRRQP